GDGVRARIGARRGVVAVIETGRPRQEREGGGALFVLRRRETLHERRDDARTDGRGLREEAFFHRDVGIAPPTREDEVEEVVEVLVGEFQYDAEVDVRVVERGGHEAAW